MPSSFIKVTSHNHNNITFEVVDVSLTITNEAQLFHILLISPQLRRNLLLCTSLGWIYTHIILHHNLLTLPLIVPLDLTDEVLVKHHDGGEEQVILM